MTEETESDTLDADLKLACQELAREVLWRNKATSADVVETLASKYLAAAREQQDFVRQCRDTDDVIAHAVRYIAHVHGVFLGTDIPLFRHTLSALIELAVPNTGITEPASKLLPCIQEGVRQSLSEVPIPRSHMRIEDEEAKHMRMLQDAGCEYGMVSELLDLVERLYHGDQMSPEDQRFFFLAATAAPLTRQARADAGIR